MLYAIADDGKIKKIDYIPHEKDFKIWRGRLSDDEYTAIQDELNKLIDDDLEEGIDIKTAGWIPGNDWTGTVWEPIYQKACLKNQEMSGMCFGLFVWIVFMERKDDNWSFGRYQIDGIDIKSLTYFRINL